MTALRASLAALVVGTLGGLALPSVQAQTPVRDARQAIPVAEIARSGAGAIEGLVLDDRGVPLAGAMVSALGATTAFDVTDTRGAFRIRALTPGAYVVRAHLGGYAPSRRHLVQVMSSARASATIELHRTGPHPDDPTDIIAAGVGPVGTTASGATGPDDHSETAWRLRHLPRSVLKDATDGVTAIAASEPPPSGGFVPGTMGFLLGRAMESSAHVASSLFGAFPFSGQFNLLTTSAFDRPQELFGPDGLSRNNVAYFSIGAAAGAHGDWAVQGALTQGDLASWILAGTYRNRMPSRHGYQFGMSYATQRYDGANPEALSAVADNTRYAGSVFGSDRWTLSRVVSVSYGARYSRYGYLDGAELFSPHVQVSVSPIEHLHLSGSVSRRMLAPGAEEFVPPSQADMWLPPSRTFATIGRAAFRPERTDHVEVVAERDFGAAVVGVRAFHQSVDDQLVTLFGVRMLDRPRTDLGHYYVATAGGLDATGWGVTFTHALNALVRGSIAYTQANATWSPSLQSRGVLKWAPSAVRHDLDVVHDLLTSLETEIPSTATRVVVLYRVNDAFARGDAHDDQPGRDARFNLQVNQALPFLNFSNAQWEMLVGVRNMFRDTLQEGSIYDELLVVRPPKRIVGGLLVKF